MNAAAPSYESILAKIDTLEDTFARTLRRVRRESFWIGWFSGVVGTWIVWWLT